MTPPFFAHNFKIKENKQTKTFKVVIQCKINSKNYKEHKSTKNSSH